MSYTSDVVPTVGPKEGYDSVAETYREYRDHLDSFDDAEWRRYLPRSLRGSTVLDLGAGDGRTFHRFAKSGFAHYRAADISHDLLVHHPQEKGIELFVTDLEQSRPWPQRSVDVMTMFFVREHLVDLQHIADEAHRVLADTGVWISTYYPQRREFVHGQGQDAFKIATEHHRYEEIEEAIDLAGFELHQMDLLDDSVPVGKVYAAVKM